MKHNPSLEIRHKIRSGKFTGNTSGVAGGHVQCNLMILPSDWAMEFMVFCNQNPKPCPLLATSETGSPYLPALGEDLDVRSDVSSYRVYENGELVASPTELHDYWRDDLVVFAIAHSLEPLFHF